MALFKKSKRNKPIQASSLQEIQQITAEGKPVFIDFWQTNCGPCQTMDGLVNELADEYKDSLNVVKVNVANAPDVVSQFRIMSTPTFVLLNDSKNSLRPRWRHSGLVKKDQLSKLVEREGAVLATAN